MNEYIVDTSLFVVKTMDNNNIYDFLNYSDDKYKYYGIFNSINSYQFKSLYEFIYKHYIICKKNLLEENDVLESFTTTDKINDNLRSFINKNISKEIFIINLIRVYFR